jgi:hypothetical protein
MILPSVTLAVAVSGPPDVYNTNCAHLAVEGLALESRLCSAGFRKFNATLKKTPWFMYNSALNSGEKKKRPQECCKVAYFRCYGLQMEYLCRT